MFTVVVEIMIVLCACACVRQVHLARIIHPIFSLVVASSSCQNYPIFSVVVTSAFLPELAIQFSVWLLHVQLAKINHPMFNLDD